MSGGECKKGDRENMRKGSSVCLLLSLPSLMPDRLDRRTVHHDKCGTPPLPARQRPYLNDDLAEEKEASPDSFCGEILGEGV